MLLKTEIRLLSALYNNDILRINCKLLSHHLKTRAAITCCVHKKDYSWMNIGVDLYYWQIVINHVTVDAICSLVPHVFLYIGYCSTLLRNDHDSEYKVYKFLIC